AARRDYPEGICPSCKDHGDQSAFQETYRDPALLIVPIRPAKNDRAIKDFDRIVEIDSVLVEIRFALTLIPIESATGFKIEFFHHGLDSVRPSSRGSPQALSQ